MGGMNECEEVGSVARVVSYCALCAWYGPLTKHHSMFPRRKYANHKLREELVVYVCRPCHDGIHEMLDHCRFKAANE